MSIGHRLRLDRRASRLYGAVFAVALLMRSWPFLTGHSIANIGEYDDGVYLASAMSVGHGSFPYAGFVMAHPPGIALLLLPFAALARLTSDPSAFVAAHVVWILLGSLNATLIALLVRRWGALAALTSGLVYATWSATAIPDRTLNLVTVMNLLICLAVLVLTRWRKSPLIAGVLLGLAMTIKIWAVVPFAGVAICVLMCRGRRAGLQLLAGGCAAATVVCLPFFVREPADMWHQVIELQIDRPRTGHGLISRSSAFFDGSLSGGSTFGALLMIVVCLGLVGPAVVALVRRRSSYVEVDVLIAVTVVELVLLRASATFFPHYLMWTAPGLALGAGRLFRDRPTPAVARRSQLPVIVGIVAALAAITLHQPSSSRPIPDQLVTVAAKAHCVWSSESTLLIQADVLDRDLAHGCAFDVDSYATVLSKPLGARLTGAHEITELRSRSWQRSARKQFLAADLLLIGPRDRRELNYANLVVLRKHFTLIGQSGQVQVYQRR